MSQKKITLTQEKETPLVPLYSKAVESQRPRPIISDPKAVEILGSIDYDFRELRIPGQTLVTLAMRAKKLDSIAKVYIDANESPLILHLGCGLDSRVLRVGDDTVRWYDLDYPDVIHLGKVFYEEEVRSLFTELRRRMPGSQIAFDAYSRLAARGANNHPSIKKTGARIHWGIDEGSRIEQWGAGIKLLEEWYFSDSEDIVSLGIWYRFTFAVARTFTAAKKAHRVLPRVFIR